MLRLGIVLRVSMAPILRRLVRVLSLLSMLRGRCTTLVASSALTSGGWVQPRGAPVVARMSVQSPSDSSNVSSDVSLESARLWLR